MCNLTLVQFRFKGLLHTTQLLKHTRVLTLILGLLGGIPTWGLPEPIKQPLEPVPRLVNPKPFPIRPNTGSTEALKIRDYLDNIPRLALVDKKAGTPQAMVGLPEGVTGTQLVGGTIVNDAAELGVLKAFPDINWAGALVQGITISSNNFAPILLPRSGGRVRLATNFVGGTGESQYRDLTVIGAGEVENATRSMLQAMAPTDAVGTVVFDYESAGTLREAMVKLGIAYKGNAVSASLDASLNSSFNQSTVIAKFTQVFYTVAFDPDPNNVSPFFGSSVKLDDVKRFVSNENPPLYVSDVKYGRILLVRFSATMSKLELEAAVQAAYQGVSGSLAARYKEQLSKVHMDFLSVGATGEIISSTVQASTPEDLINRLKAAIDNGIRYNPTTNPGAPIAFTMRCVGSRAGQGPYAVAIAQMVTQASPEVVALNSNEVCKGPFYVWDGPGGGTKDTDIDLTPGDKLRLQARGTNWSGVRLTGDYGPAGWYTWDAPGGDARGYPIIDRSPFALIARLGNANSFGVDRTKWGFTESNGKQPSDWFFVGDSTQLVVGDVDRQTGRGVMGYGRLYLGTNDNEPFNGDQYKQFTVTACFTRKVY